MSFQWKYPFRWTGRVIKRICLSVCPLASKPLNFWWKNSNHTYTRIFGQHIWARQAMMLIMFDNKIYILFKKPKSSCHIIKTINYCKSDLFMLLYQIKLFAESQLLMSNPPPPPPKNHHLIKYAPNMNFRSKYGRTQMMLIIELRKQ